MTTSVCLQTRLERTEEPSSTLSLREWLGRDWAILFSHPADFDQEQFERDRWIRVLERGFSEHAVRPLGLASHGYAAHAATSLGWLEELGEGCAARLSAAMPLKDTPHDFRASALRARILDSSARFAMIIDSELRGCRTLRYRAPTRLPSPLELLGWAVALRERHRRDPHLPASDDMTELLPSEPDVILSVDCRRQS